MSNPSLTPKVNNPWVQPLIPLLVVAAVSIGLLYLGGVLAYARGATDDAALPLTRWVGVVVAAVVILYFLYVSQAEKDVWAFGTRQVVYAAIGAALYGVLSWLTNVVQLPSISLVALRPAIVIPVFFGVAFGPVVGFFAGFVGNILGDALTGWGVYPLWDVGNGILGLVAGLVLAFKDSRRAVNALTIVVAVVAIAASVLLWLNAGFTVSDFSGKKNAVGPCGGFPFSGEAWSWPLVLSSSRLPTWPRPNSGAPLVS